MKDGLINDDPKAGADTPSSGYRRGHGKGAGAANADPSSLLSLMDHAPHAMLLVSRSGHVTAVAGNAEGIFGRSAASLQGVPLGGLMPFGAFALPLADRCRWDMSPVSAYDIRDTDRQNRPWLADLHIRPMGDGGDVLFVLSPRGAATLHDRDDTVTAAVKSVTGLGDMLAHELKNPLAGIRGAAQLLARPQTGTDSDARARLCDVIVREVDRIGALVEDFSGLADAEAGVARGPVNIHRVLDHVMTVSRAREDAAITFKTDFDPSLPPVTGDFDKLVQVFLNLFQNALDVGEGAATVHVASGYRHGMWRPVAPDRRIKLPVEISVRDLGPGVTADLLPHIFDPFVSGRPAGTGLGLALVARYISAMNGTVRVQNHPDGGAEFLLYFAVADEGGTLSESAGP